MVTRGRVGRVIDCRDGGNIGGEQEHGVILGRRNLRHGPLQFARPWNISSTHFQYGVFLFCRSPPKCSCRCKLLNFGSKHRDQGGEPLVRKRFMEIGLKVSFKIQAPTGGNKRLMEVLGLAPICKQFDPLGFSLPLTSTAGESSIFSLHK